MNDTTKHGNLIIFLQIAVLLFGIEVLLLVSMFNYKSFQLRKIISYKLPFSVRGGKYATVGSSPRLFAEGWKRMRTTGRPGLVLA